MNSQCIVSGEMFNVRITFSQFVSYHEGNVTIHNYNKYRMYMSITFSQKWGKIIHMYLTFKSLQLNTNIMLG